MMVVAVGFNATVLNSPPDSARPQRPFRAPRWFFCEDVLLHEFRDHLILLCQPRLFLGNIGFQFGDGRCNVGSGD